MLCKEKILHKLDKIDFKNEILLPHPQHQSRNFDAFVKREKRVDNATFDISLIIGTDHPDYANKTWLECINNLKRGNVLGLLRCDNERPSILYYTDTVYRNDSQQDPWSIDVINDKAYITQGNHRSIISRFLSSLNIIPKEQFGLSYVNYIEYDEKGARLYERFTMWFEKLPLIIKDNIEFSVSHKVISDTNGIKISEPKYSLLCGHLFYKIYENYNEPMFENHSSFMSFKKEVFKQVKYYKQQYRYILPIIGLYNSLLNKFYIKS